jgi:O-antigen/teichoic acid export membrane protein
MIGLEAAGAMRAVQALFQPLDQVIASLGLLLVPAVARRGRLGGLPTIRLWSRRISAAYGSAAALYGVALTVAAAWVLDLLYGGAYDRYGWMIPVMALGSVAASAGHGLVIGLNAAERTDAIFKSRAIGAASSLIAGLPMVAAWKLPGAVSAVALSALAICASLAFFHWQTMRVDRTRIR